MSAETVFLETHLSCGGVEEVGGWGVHFTVCVAAAQVWVALVDESGDHGVHVRWQGDCDVMHV